MNRFRRLLLIVFVVLAAVGAASAQPTPFRYELLSLLPDDFAVCVILHDLRGHSDRWEKSAWLEKLKESPVGKSLLASPEMKQLEHFRSELKTHLDIDWPTLRDDILGDTVILAHSPGPKNKPEEEQGLVLLALKKPDTFRRFMDHLNDAQKKSGELKSLSERQHKGKKYYARVQADKTHFYCIDDTLAMFAVREEQMQTLIAKKAGQQTVSPWVERFKKAGVEQAIATLCVNPRTLDAEVAPAGKKDDPLPSYWRALEAIFVTASIRDSAELRIAIQANPEKLPKWASPAFRETITQSSLWQRFPEESILTIASQTDFAGAADALKLIMPEKDRAKLSASWQGNFGILRLDFFKDLLPNIGPDWGMCVLPAENAKSVPMTMFALEVRPGSKEQPVDQSLFKAVEFFAQTAAKINPKANVRIESVKQDAVEVKYLASDTLFPAGFQPAAALKDGYLVLATSPDAVKQFSTRRTTTPAVKESLLVRISAPELAKLLDQRRAHILSTLTEGQQMGPEQAQRNLENVISLLRLFDRATISQQGGNCQASWIVRLTPAK